MPTFTRDGLTFDLRDRGPSDAPAVVLLHGFPQDGTAYDDVVPILTSAGLRSLVPDQRGYSPGARPPSPRAYVLSELVDDVVALLDTAGVARAHVVGHDWGGAVAWALAGAHPQRVRSLTVLSTPHPAAMQRAMLRGQARRSSYMLGFQLPGRAERRLLADDAARLRRMLTGSGLPQGQVDRYVARMAGPGALTAALSWYRALPLRDDLRTGRVRVPTTYLHGAADPFFARASVLGTGRFVSAPFRSVRLAAGHWLPETCPAAVADAVREHAGA